MKDFDLMPFGKYKGHKMANIPASYLIWLYDKGGLKDEAVKAYIEENREVLDKENIRDCF
ncbi:MAG: DUF3820 family protein [Bacteroidales bacterium]|nr:DUF3820 family protein [Bacteroidales bacterium]